MTAASLLPVVLLLNLIVLQAVITSSAVSSVKRNCVAKTWNVWGLCQSTPRGFIQLRTRSNPLAPNFVNPFSLPSFGNLNPFVVNPFPTPSPNPTPAIPYPAPAIPYPFVFSLPDPFQYRTCNRRNATSSLIRSAIGSLVSAKSFCTKPPSWPSWAQWKLASSWIAARNPDKTFTTTNGNECSVLKDPSNGKIFAIGKCIRIKVPLSITSSASCQNQQKRDILFLIDRSGSIRAKNIQKMRDMTAGLINIILCDDITLCSIRIGVATFSAEYEKRIPFDRYVLATQKQDLIDAVQDLNFISDGSTYLGEALYKARTDTLFDDGCGVRSTGKGVKKSIFLISDGCANGDVTIASQASYLKNQNIDVFVVQVGSNESCKQKMSVLDGGDPNTRSIFFYNDWMPFSDAANDFLSDSACTCYTWECLINE